jgi:hypothetical protein
MIASCAKPHRLLFMWPRLTACPCSGKEHIKNLFLAAAAVVVEQVSSRRILVAFNVGVPLVIERKKKYRCLDIVIV